MAFLDLRASYKFGDEYKTQVFLALDNILNTDPPIISNSTQTSLPYFFEPTRTDLYDDLGMSVRVGVRMHVD